MADIAGLEGKAQCSLEVVGKAVVHGVSFGFGECGQFTGFGGNGE